MELDFVHPRRFGEMWQMNEDWPGTIQQQMAVRAALTPVYGTNFHRLTQKMDRYINEQGRSYLPVAFFDLGDNFLGRGNNAGLILSHNLKDPTIIARWARHEMGHVYDQLGILSQDDKFFFMEEISGHHNGNWPNEYQETWAEAFREWVESDGERWNPLTVRLLS